MIFGPFVVLVAEVLVEEVLPLDLLFAERIRTAAMITIAIPPSSSAPPSLELEGAAAGLGSAVAVAGELLAQRRGLRGGAAAGRDLRQPGARQGSELARDRGRPQPRRLG